MKETESKGTFISFYLNVFGHTNTDALARSHGRLQRSFKVKHWCEVDRRELQNNWTQATPLNECGALTAIERCLEAERVVRVTSHLSPAT